MLLDHLTDAAHFDTNTMASSTNFFVPSPSISIPPSQEYFGNAHYANNGTPSSFSNPTGLTPNASIPPTPGSMAGRKRSRGDIYEDDDIEPDGSLPTPASEAGMDEQMMGSGQPFELNYAKRPSIASRKSQRLGPATSSDDLGQLVLPSSIREVTNLPLIDEATRTLGISWTRMDSREALLINQAAYARFITNHYPALREVEVWFENSAVPCYLVRSLNVYNGNREFWLFANDLTEARLVTRDPADLIPRLQLLPALHLAAPGGTIKAEMDPITAAQTELDNVVHAQAVEKGVLQQATPRSDSDGGAEMLQPEGICAAHSMELD